MRKYFLLVVLMTLVTGCPAYAGEGDKSAEARYHDAYVLEVVEGKVPEAARVYLTLLGEQATPTTLRHAAKFRFAICAVLLGRSDEARGHLDDLLRDERVSEALRARVEAYRKAVSGIGLGSELDKKLQELVFDLAKAKVTGQPPVYRDFEVIGEQAVPFLRKLLQHRDKLLRYHAFRLLLRMDEPDLIDRWTPDVMVTSWIWFDLTPYLARHPEARAKLEKRYLAGELMPLRELSEVHQPPAFSPAFLRGFLERTKDANTAVRLARFPVTEARDALLAAWTQSEDAGLRVRALDAVARHAWQRPIGDDALFLRVIDFVIEDLQDTKDTQGVAAEMSKPWPALRSAKAVVTGLDRLVLAGATWKGQREKHPLFGDPNDHAVTLLLSMRGRELSAETQKRFADVLRRWIAQIGPHYAADGAKPRRNYANAIEILTRVLRPLLESMPQTDAEAFVIWLFQGTGHESPGEWGPLFKAPHSERSLRLTFLAAMQVASGFRWEVLVHLPITATPNIPSASRDAQLEALVALLPGLESPPVYRVVRVIARVAATLEPKAREALLNRVFDLGPKMDDTVRVALQQQIVSGDGTAKYLVDIGLPFAEAHWATLKPQARNTALAAAIHHATDRPTTLEQREALRAFVRHHRTELSSGLIDRVAQKDDAILSYEDWVPLARWRNLQHTGTFIGQAMARLKEERADEVAANLLADENVEVNDATIGFVLNETSYDVRARYADRFLTLTDPGLLAFTLARLNHQNGKPATAEGLEAALASELTRTPPNDELLFTIAKKLLNRQPSAKLIPAARRLLKASDPQHVLFGATMAGSLGSEALTSDLESLLGSMNAHIRRAVTTALEEIRQLRQLRNDDHK